MQNNRYIITFVLIMTAVVAIVLALMSTALKPIHDKNEAVYNKRAILAAIEKDLGKKVSELSDNEVIDIFENQITQRVFDMSGNELDKAAVEAKGYKGGLAENIDMSKDKRKPESERILPTYIFKAKDGKTKTILSIRGSGLWDEIWGNVALDEDLNTISGIVFDHKAETAGLGAEIKDNLAFPRAFEGKKIYDANNNYKSVDVVKGGLKDPAHQVDAISGATITTVGVGEMMKRGIKYYEPSFEKLKK